MKIVIYANVTRDWKDIVHTPYGVAQFRSYITRSFITSNLPYKHPSKKAVPRDIIVWAFRTGKTWYLVGDGYVSGKEGSDKKGWAFWIESARLYPRGVPLDELSFADKVKKRLNVGYSMNWNEYRQLLEKASEQVV